MDFLQSVGRGKLQCFVVDPFDRDSGDGIKVFIVLRYQVSVATLSDDA